MTNRSIHLVLGNQGELSFEAGNYPRGKYLKYVKVEGIVKTVTYAGNEADSTWKLRASWILDGLFDIGIVIDGK